MSDDLEIVDAWLQHPTPKLVGHPMFESIRRWMGIEEVPDEIPPDLTIGAMDAAGVDTAMLSAWWGPSGPIISNEAVAELVEEHSDRFVGIGSVDLNEPMQAYRQVYRCVEEFGFRGIRVLPWLWERPPDHRSYYPVYVACCELEVPFCLQVGHTGPLKPSEPGRPIPYLERVALDFPSLTIVGGHIGHPWTDEMISLARKYTNVYIDTSAYKPKRFPEELVEYLRHDGAQKVLFGSNFPMIMPADALEGLEELQLDESLRRAFLAENAGRVFGLDSA